MESTVIKAIDMDAIHSFIQNEKLGCRSYENDFILDICLQALTSKDVNIRERYFKLDASLNVVWEKLVINKG